MPRTVRALHHTATHTISTSNAPDAMNTSKTRAINIFADVIAPLGVVGVTIALFLVFMPENAGSLYWFNLVFSSFLEILLFAYIVWLPRREGSVVLKWMFGTFTVAYICLSFLWMLLFSLILVHWLTLKVYFSVIAALTVIWIFIGATTVKADNSAENSDAVLKHNRTKTDRVINRAEMLSDQFNLLKTIHPELTQASTSVNALCRGLATLSPSAMADDSAAKRINAIIAGLEEIFDGSASDLAPSRIKEYADQSIISLNSIKKAIRK